MPLAQNLGLPQSKLPGIWVLQKKLFIVGVNVRDYQHTRSGVCGNSNCPKWMVGCAKVVQMKGITQLNSKGG
ncbi:hypothetical protein RN42_02145 [Serratia marcescens]|nr:hypothetical protein RN42_02145 [Serratia marcescens]